jgi:hypothetical protein
MLHSVDEVKLELDVEAIASGAAPMRRLIASVGFVRLHL